MAKTSGKVETSLNPAGFVEQKYSGKQTQEDVVNGVKEIKIYVDKLIKQKKTVLILIDLTDLGSTDVNARIAGIRAIKGVRFDRGAMFGPLKNIILVNTLTMVAGKQDKVCAFSSRAEAIAWLLRGKSG